MPRFYRPIPGKSVPEFVEYTDELWAVASNTAALNYLDEQSDVKEQAVAKTLARGITPDNPEFPVTLANYGKEHWQRFGKTENRQGVGANALRSNPGFADLGQANAVGATPNLVFQGSTAEDFVTTVPRTGPNQPPTIIPNPAPPSEDAGGGDSEPGGDDVIFGPPPGDTSGPPPGGGMMSGPVDLDPVTNLIGATGDTGQSTLMGRQADLASDIAGVRGVVNPIGEQVTALDAKVTPLAGNVGEIKTGVTNLGTNVGTAADNTGLYKPISTLQGDVTGISSAIGTQAEGQPDLLTGQKDLTRDVGNVQTGVTNLTTNIGAPPAEGGPQTLFAGQADISKAIGTPTDGQTLFGGQRGLMSGQTGLTTDIRKVGSDLTTTGTNLQKAIQDFQAASQEYQAGATAKRGDIANTAIANQNTLMGSLGDVGLNTNRAAEMLTKQRQDEAAQYKVAQAPLQQQIANLTANNNAQGNANQQIGALGPMAADPRDALIQQLLTRNASLMNNRPV